MKLKGPASSSDYIKWKRQNTNQKLFRTDLRQGLNSNSRFGGASLQTSSDLPAKGLFSEFAGILLPFIIQTLGLPITLDPRGVLGMAVDSSNNIYFTNGPNIRKISTSGQLLGTVTVSVGSGNAGLPWSISVSGNKLLVGTLGNTASFTRVYSIDLTTFSTATVEVSGSVGGFQLNTPAGVCGDSAGNIYFTHASSVWRKNASDSSFVRVVNTLQSLNFATVLATRFESGTEFLYVVSTNNHSVFKYNLTQNLPINQILVAGTNDTSGYTGDGGLATACRLRNPRGITFGPDGIYIVDYGNNVIRIIDNNGIIRTYLGTGQASSAGDGGPPEVASFNGPQTILFIGSSTYIAEGSGNRIRVITET